MARVKVEGTKELSYIDLLTMLAEDVESDQILGKADKQAALERIEVLQDILYAFSDLLKNISNLYRIAFVYSSTGIFC